MLPFEEVRKLLDPITDVYNQLTQEDEERTRPVRQFSTAHYTFGEGFQFSDISDLNVTVDFEFLSTRHCEATRGIQLSRMQFFDTNRQEVPWHVISIHQGVYDPNEGPDKLLDPNLSTWWFDLLLEQCRQSTKLTARLADLPSYYTFTTAPDHLERDPHRWRVSFGNRSWTETQSMPTGRGVQSDPITLSVEEYNYVDVVNGEDASTKCTCPDGSSYRASECELGTEQPFTDTDSSVNPVAVTCALDLNLCDCQREGYSSSAIEGCGDHLITGCDDYCGTSTPVCVVDSRCPFAMNSTDPFLFYMENCQGCPAEDSYDGTKVGRASVGQEDCPPGYFKWLHCSPDGWLPLASSCVKIGFTHGVTEFPGYFPMDIRKKLNFTISGILRNYVPVYVYFIEGSAIRGSDWVSLQSSPVVLIPPEARPIEGDRVFSTEEDAFLITSNTMLRESRNFTIQLILPPYHIMDSIEIVLTPTPPCGSSGRIATATREMYRCEDGLITTEDYRERACLDVETGESLFSQSCSQFASDAEICASSERESNATLATICYKYDCCTTRTHCDAAEAAVEFCHCSADFSGPMCETEVDMQCEIGIPSAPECDEPLRIGNYDPELDGDMPCNLINPLGILNTSFQLDCSLDLSQKESNIPEGYSFDNPQEFDYWADSGDFKLTYQRDYFVQKKLFNFNRPSDSRQTVIMYPNLPSHFTGELPFHFALNVPDLGDDFITSGRVYAEYRECRQCKLEWEEDGDVPYAYKQSVLSCECPSEISVQRRFYDLEGYKLTTTSARRNKTALWVGLPLTMIILAILTYFVWKRRSTNAFSFS